MSPAPHSHRIPPEAGDLGRLPAPSDLELVRSLINSRNVEGEAKIEAPSSQWDKLATPSAAEAWLRERGLNGPKAKISAGDAARLRALREALRGLAGRNSGLDLPVDVGVLKRAADDAHLALGFDTRTGRVEMKPASNGIEAVFSTILTEVHDAMHDGTWERLKICATPTCLWAFYDRSKNLHSRWCSPTVCGNRDKVRRYRERTRKRATKRRS